MITAFAFSLEQPDFSLPVIHPIVLSCYLLFLTDSLFNLCRHTFCAGSGLLPQDIHISMLDIFIRKCADKYTDRQIFPTGKRLYAPGFAAAYRQTAAQLAASRIRPPPCLRWRRRAAAI